MPRRGVVQRQSVTAGAAGWCSRPRPDDGQTILTVVTLLDNVRNLHVWSGWGIRTLGQLLCSGSAHGSTGATAVGNPADR
jgi:hypothetical protein